MTNDGKIYIVITDTAPSGTTVSAPINSNTESHAKKEEKNNLLNHWAKNRILSTTKSIGSQAVLYSFHNIGNFTGDYITQAKVNESLEIVSSLAGIGMSAIAGFSVGGPIGAVIGASLDVINRTVSSAFSINTRMVENRKTNYEIEQLRIRAGLNSILDGSRGTEN